MEHAKPDAIAPKGGAAFAIEGEGNVSLRVAGDDGFPRKINFALPTFRVEGDAERVSGDCRLQVGNLPGDGVPLMIPHHSINAAHDFEIAQPDVTQKPGVRLEEHGERAGPQREGLGRCRLTTESENID